MRRCSPAPAIQIYRLNGSQKSLVKKFPIKVIDHYKDYKWGFIRHYWLTKYTQFR